MARKTSPDWNKLPRQRQDLYLTLLWEDGHSEGAIAKFFNVGKGVIVRRRQTGLKLKTAGRKEKIKTTVSPERFRDLLDLRAMRELEDQGVTCIASDVAPTPSTRAGPPTPKYKMAASEATQCRHESACGYERVPGSDFCLLHVPAKGQ